MKNVNKIALVVPSIRKDSLERFEREWEPTGLFSRVDLLLVEDNLEKSFQSRHALYHWSWKEIDAVLQDKSWIIPRRSDTVRSFGYYMAHLLKYEYIMTLDDDCYPEPGYGNLDEKHLEMLNGRSRWFNTLPYVKPRGVPFYNTGSDRKVYVNHGLWTHVLDYDAPTQLVAPDKEEFTHDNRIVPQHSYFPFCGMNAMWRREANVFMYHLLMGQMKNDALLVKLQFDRFGDIWAGILMKKVCDHLGWNVSTGIPYIHHDRASNVFANLKKEANGLEVNEDFWQYVDSYVFDADLDNASDCYHRLGQHIAQYKKFPEHNDYFFAMGKAMQTWADLFGAIQK